MKSKRSLIYSLIVLFLFVLATSSAGAVYDQEEQALEEPSPPGWVLDDPLVSELITPGDSQGWTPAAADEPFTGEPQALEGPFLNPRFEGSSSGPDIMDPVVQTQIGDTAMPAPIANWEGISATGVLPPDTDGQVGPNHYVQLVNSPSGGTQVRVWNKAGTQLYDFSLGSLWSIDDPCNWAALGDPVVIYDQLADRWLLTQFAIPDPPYYECIAVSQTGVPDPSAFWTYSFLVHQTKLNDYPKLGVWPDGYYMSANQFDVNGYAGAGVWVFDRNAMLAGAPTTFQYFDLAAVDIRYFGLLPSNLMGDTLPPSGAPNYFMSVDMNWVSTNDVMHIFEFHTDWVTPANSTFTLVAEPVVDPFDWDLCPNFRERCIDQPDGAPQLEAISDRLMMHLWYRNYGTHESLVTNHTVDVNGNGRAGIRWYEFRGGAVDTTLADATIYQQDTYAPAADGDHRWMGSIAQDCVGNIALGYSVSSTTTYPSIRYAGRLAGDPLGTLPQAEVEIIPGSGVQTHSAARWGDYSAMSVDPVNDCTFWYTQEYIETTGSAPWQTRVASFEFPGCQGPPPANCYRILFDETHGVDGSFTIGNRYSETADLLRSKGHTVDALIPPATFDYATISQYDVLALVLPQNSYSSGEMDDIAQFVNEGGRLVTVGEWSAFAGSNNILNEVHAHLGDGLSHNNDMVHDPTDFDSNDFWPLIHTFAPDPVNDGLFSVLELAGSSLSVSAPGYGTAFGDDDTYTTASLMLGAEGAESTLGPATSVEFESRMELVYEGQAAVGESNAPAGDVVGSSYVYHGPQATANILIYADDIFHVAPNTYLDQALQALGLSYTAYYDSDFAGFETALTGGGPWDLVLFGNDQWSPPASVFTALDNYVNGGGSLVFNGWTVGGDPANPLWSTLGFSWVSNDTSPPDPVYWWDPGHPFFNSPESVPEFTSLVDVGYTTFGQHVEPLAGFTAVAGYTTPGPDPNEAALIVGNDGRTIFRGFMDGHNDADLDTDGTPDGVELWINLINHMVGEVVVQAKSNLGAGDVFAIGDGDIWANAHHNKFDNNQLAWNVFAFGDACVGACYRILFDETHGWASDGSVGNYIIEDGFSQLAGFLVSKGHTVHSLQDPSPFDYATISQYDVLVLMLPKESYSTGEMDAIDQFVNEGGQLVTIGEWSGFAGVSNGILNEVHSHLGDGLTHNNDTVFDPTNNVMGNSIWPIIHNFEADPVNDLLDRVVEYAGSSLSVSGPAYGTAFGDDDTTSGPITMSGSEGAASGLGPMIPVEFESRMELVSEGQASVGESNAPAGDVMGSSYVYHGPQATANILIYADDNYHLAPNTYLDQALQALGLSYTAYYDSDFAGFETALTSGGPWDLVLFGNDNWGPPATTFTALDNYVNGGGSLVFTGWTVGSDPANPLWTTLGFSWVSNDTSPPDPVYWWDPGHQFFTSPESVPEFTSLVDGRYGTFGQHVEPLAGFTAVAGYTTPGPASNEAALIVGNDGRTIFKGFLDGHNDADLDTDGTPDGVELWINLIASFSEVVVQAKSNVGAGTVFAIGDANLWDNVDYEGNGISSLFEFNNEQLAWNVFASGEVCVGEAGVALEPDRASDATPGETIVYNHVLTNTGTVEDTFTLSAISSEGWTINHSPDPTLAPGASTNVTVEVTVPGGAIPGTVDTTTLTAESQFDPAVSASVVDTTTVVPELGFIEGWVTMQGRSDHTGAEVCAWDSGVMVDCGTTDVTGYFTVTLPASIYDLTAEMSRYLDSEKLGVSVVAGSTTTLSTVTLKGGDANDDDTVNILDLSFMGARYNCSFGDPCYDAKADINDDLTINIQDLAIAGGNYLETSPVPWP